MPHFIRNSAVAMTWSPNGQCRGVRLKRSGDKCRVVDFWNGSTDPEHAAPEIIAEGAKALAAKDAACFIASAVNSGWDAADVDMPELPAAQLKNALAFELRKHTPLTPDKLVWGYRLLAKHTKTQKAKYRIVFAKKDTWNQCCNAFAAVAPVDLIVPAPAVIDPLCEKLTVTFPRADGSADAFLPTPQGRTFKPASTKDANQQYIPLTELIACDFISLEDLEKLTVQEQYTYADAILLAVYAMTDNASKDADTLIQLPEGLRPHRSPVLVVSACILLAVTIAAAVLYAALNLKANIAQQRELKECLARLETEINRQKATIRPERLEKIKELQQELKDEIPNYPPLPLALNEISEIISPDGERKPWIASRFIWSHENNTLKFSVEEPLGAPGEKAFIERPALIDELADCPYILDVRGNSSTINRSENKCIREFTITLGWPEPEKRKAAAKRNLQRKAERKAEREKREQLRRQAREQAQALPEEEMEEHDNQSPNPTSQAPRTRFAPDSGAPPMRGLTPPPPPPMP